MKKLKNSWKIKNKDYSYLIIEKWEKNSWIFWKIKDNNKIYNTNLSKKKKLKPNFLTIFWNKYLKNFFLTLLKF